MAGMVFVSNGFHPGTTGYGILTAGVAVIVVVSTSTFTLLVLFEVYRSLRYAKQHEAARRAEAGRIEAAYLQRRRRPTRTASGRSGGSSGRKSSAHLDAADARAAGLTAGALRILGVKIRGPVQQSAGSGAVSVHGSPTLDNRDEAARENDGGIGTARASGASYGGDSRDSNRRHSVVSESPSTFVRAMRRASRVVALRVRGQLERLSTSASHRDLSPPHEQGPVSEPPASEPAAANFVQHGVNRQAAPPFGGQDVDNPLLQQRLK